MSDADRSLPTSPPWPFAEIEGRRVVAFTASDVDRGRALLGELERSLLAALGSIQAGDKATATAAVQTARSTLARWGGELSALVERLG